MSACWLYLSVLATIYVINEVVNTLIKIAKITDNEIKEEDEISEDIIIMMYS